MSRNPGEVLKRALAAVASVLVAVTAIAVLARPAGAGERESDPLADTAAQTLVDLRGARVAEVAAALAGGLISPAAAIGTYRADLDRLAGAVAERTATPAEAFARAWRQADSARMTALLSALSQVGVPYRSRASDPGNGFDCSGLTMFAWGEAGVALPHQDRSQMNMSAPRTWETAEPADLVQYPGHVMMYLGAGEAIVHAPNTGTVVRVQDLGGHSVRLASPTG
jgi:cell wall-associated NlpC family hydrolase